MVLFAKKVFFQSSLKIYVNEASKVISERKSHFLNIIWFDLDDFTKVNTKFTHKGGDTILKKIGELLREKKKEYKKEYNIVMSVRHGGEELYIISVSDNKDKGYRIAANLKNEISSIRFPFIDGMEKYKQTVSIGYAQLEITLQKAQEIQVYMDDIGAKGYIAIKENLGPIFEMKIREADKACYESKLRGKNRISIYDPAKDKLGYYEIVGLCYNLTKDNWFGLRRAEKIADFLFSFRKLQNKF